MAYQRLNLSNGDTLTERHISHIEGGIAIAQEGYLGIFPDEECRNAFIKEMRDYCTRIGATGSTWAEPTGYYGNTTTAKDICKILVMLSGYEKIYDIWNTPSKVVRRIQPDGSVQEFTLHSTVTGKTFSSAANGSDTSEFTDYYNVMGGKTGSLPAKAQYNYAIIAQSNKNPQEWYAIASLKANAANGNEGNRYQAMKEIMDMIESEDFSTGCSSNSVYAVKLTPYNARAFQYLDLVPVYAKNEELINYPCSTTKLLVSIIVLDYVTDLNETITVTQEDLDAIQEYGSPASQPWEVRVGETFTYKDLLYFMLLPSSNLATQVLARGVGEKILKSKKGVIYAKLPLETPEISLINK